MDERTDLWELPVPSTYLGDVTATDDGGSLTLGFDYHRGEVDGRYSGGLRFARVRAYRHRAESHCTVWHVDAYDTLQEIKDSEWVRELVDALPEDLRDHFELHHYVIYFDSSGCYEAVAASWEAFPEAPVGPERP